ncbi:MAG TPA: hypothetical protein PLD12_08355 [Bacteroidales bacterium]|nr:hypothetical protein [Bacteroidales bacterium]
MRTKNLFQVLTAGLFMLTLSTAAFAQLTTSHLANSTDTTTTAGENPNVVTVGARVPFAIQSSSDIWQLQKQGVLASQSVWKWEMPNNTASAQLYDKDGNNLLSTFSDTLGQEDFSSIPGFYLDSVISIDFPATGNVTLQVTERTVSNISGITGCEGDIEHLQIQVVNAPTVAFNDADRIMGGCGADQSFDSIPLTVTGNGYFASNGGLAITYKIDYIDLAGDTTNLVSTTIKDTAGVFTGWAQFSVNNGSTDVFITYDLPDGQYGTYTVTLLAVTDEISRKTLDALADYDKQGLPPVAERTLKIYALPTPNTQPIKHISNLGW